jgi:hypothetical protein
MPYNIQTKDGIILRNIPDDIAKDSDVLKQRISDIRSGNKTQEQPIIKAAPQPAPQEQSQQPAPQEQAPQQPLPEAPSGLLRGAMDPIDAGAQLLAKITPSRLEQSINKFNNWLVEKGVPLAKIPEPTLQTQITGEKTGLEGLLQQQEQQYQAGREAAGKTGMDWARLAGNVASPANLLLASRVPQAATLGGRMAAGAGLGAAFGASQPVTEGDFWTEKAKQVGLGAATGGVLPVATGAIARVIQPKTATEVQAMMKEGITPTMGQILGGGAKAAEEKAKSIPILGDAIRMAHEKSKDKLQIAAYKRALGPIGEKPGGEIGHAGIAEVRKKLNAYFEELLPKTTFQADDQLAADMSKIREMVSALPEDSQRFFDKTIQRELGTRIEQSGKMAGENLQKVHSELGKIAESYKAKGGFEGDIGNAISEVRDAIMSNLERNSPKHAEQLRKAKEGWANYAILREAASGKGAKEGVFTPAQLVSAVMKQTKVGKGAAGKRAVAEGTGRMQEFASQASKVLSPNYPDSGTAGRALQAGLLGGAGMAVNPGALVGLAGTTLPYLPGGAQTMAALLTRRPDIAAPLAQGVRQLGPALTPGMIPFLNQGNQ